MNEHDFEPVRGLPAALPLGERMLWQGAPEWRSLVGHAFGTRALMAYFALLAAWGGGRALAAGDGLLACVHAALVVLAVGLGALAVMLLFWWMTARTTTYTITSRRVVIRSGIALSMTVNLPFARIVSAGLRDHGDGTGDLVLQLARERVAYLSIWPHVRLARLARPEPLLRAVPNARTVADILATALAATVEVDNAAPAAATAPARPTARPVPTARPAAA